MREFGSEFHIAYGKDVYFDHISSLKRYCRFVRTGREALLLAARSIPCIGSKVILMPAYCCWSMEAPFVQEGYDLVYYRLNYDLSVDMDYLMAAIKKHAPSAILVMNYFGFTPTKEAVKFVKQIDNQIRVIEDFSHCLFSLSEIFNPEVDYYVASIRKSIGLPDGAVYISDNAPTHIETSDEQAEFIRLRSHAERLKCQYQYTANGEDKMKFLEELALAATILKGEIRIVPRCMSMQSQDIMYHTSSKEFVAARVANYTHLYGIISSNSLVQIPLSPMVDHTAPFALPILSENRDGVQRVLAQNGIYAPVLWPISERASQVCSTAKRFAEQMLAIPIDQRYDYYDMEELGSRINNILK